MKLIAESGSTRTEWALVEDNRLVQRVFTEGLNPFFQTRREISRSVRLGLPESFFKRKLEQVYYYGAGCTSYEKKNVLGASLVAQFKTPIKLKAIYWRQHADCLNVMPELLAFWEQVLTLVFMTAKSLLKM